MINKDTGNAGWWKGKINYREGVFPDNFAVQMNELGKDLPKPRKPPPPLKGRAPKPELVSAEKKYFPVKSEEKDVAYFSTCRKFFSTFLLLSF